MVKSAGFDRPDRRRSRVRYMNLSDSMLYSSKALYSTLVVECEAGPYVELCPTVPASSCLPSASNSLPISHDVIFEAAGHSCAMSRRNPTAATAAKRMAQSPPVMITRRLTDGLPVKRHSAHVPRLG